MPDGDTTPLFRLAPPQKFSRKQPDRRLPPPPPRVANEHGSLLSGEATGIRDRLDRVAKALPKLATDVPYVRIQPASKMVITDDEVRALGLRPVLRRPDAVFAAYAVDREMGIFFAKVADYSTQKRKYSTFAKIEHIGPWSREDRLSVRLREKKIEHGKTYVVDLLLLPTDIAPANPRAVAAIRQFVGSEGGEVLDQALDPGFTAMRVRLGGQSLESLLEYRDDIALVDLPPIPVTFYHQAHQLDLGEVDVGAPEPIAPGICVVDSGILEGHPLLEKSILGDLSRSFPTKLGPPVPPAIEEAAHGTKVAGVALYGDLRPCVDGKKFSARFWLANARLLDDNSDLDPDRMPFMREIVEHAREKCRIFNLSFGLHCCDGLSSQYAAELDELAREYDVLFVVSAGNIRLRDEFPGRLPVKPYPDFLLEKKWLVLNPAQALNVLTVGGITPDGELLRLPKTAEPVAGKHQPSPFGRSGGQKSVVKPELVEIAGNVAFDGTLNQWETHDPGLQVTTTGHEYAKGSMITFVSGTSIATPKVSHLAAAIVAKFPDGTPNLIRALLVQSAQWPKGVSGWNGIRKAEEILRLCGFGVPNEDRALFCRPQRATYYYEGAILPGDVQIFGIPIPPEVHQVKGNKCLTVTLAYDPPVSALQLDQPAGVTITWDIARGDVPIEVLKKAIVAEAVEKKPKERGKKKTKEKKKREKSPFMAKPGLPKRPQQRGTIRKNSYEWKNRGEFGDIYHLAVTAKANRPNHDKDQQRFAVVVTLECEDTGINLPVLVRARLAAGRVRLRVPGDAAQQGEGS